MPLGSGVTRFISKRAYSQLICGKSQESTLFTDSCHDNFQLATQNSIVAMATSRSYYRYCGCDIRPLFPGSSSSKQKNWYWKRLNNNGGGGGGGGGPGVGLAVKIPLTLLRVVTGHPHFRSFTSTTCFFFSNAIESGENIKNVYA